MGNTFECCMTSAVSGVSTIVSHEASEMTDKSTEKANKELDKMSGIERQEEKLDNAFEKVLATGNDLIFNSKKSADQHKRAKVRAKSHKQMENIRNKYSPQPAVVPKKQSAKDRQSYEDLKARLKK